MARSSIPVTSQVVQTVDLTQGDPAVDSQVVENFGGGGFFDSIGSTVGRLSGAIGSGLSSIFSGGGSATGSALGGTGNPTTSLGSTTQQGAANLANTGANVNAALNRVGVSVPILGQISGLAGGLSNIFGLFKSKNILPGAEIFKGESQSAYVEVKQGLGDDWRVRLDCNFNLFPGAFPRLIATSGLVWPYLPNFTIVSRANYTQQDPVHNIQPFNAYKNSMVEDIQISGDFSVENEADAEYWIQATTFLRTATKMFFGESSYSGNPPAICNLTGYGSRVFNNVPVIIKSFSIDFKEDVQYMKYTSANTWVPVLSTISVTVSPIYNRSRLRKFSLQDFASGRAVGYM
jgi:hypothetical protein